MKKMMAILAACALLALAMPALADTDSQREMNGDEWLQYKAAFLAKKPIDGMGTYAKGDRYPGCRVCYYNPSCRSGYTQTGYTDMVNYMVVDAWGKVSPGPGGYVPLSSQTIVKDGVCVHDHVRSGVCDKQ